MRMQWMVAAATVAALAVLMAACGSDKGTEPTPTPFWTARQANVGYNLWAVCWGDSGFTAVGYSYNGQTVAAVTSSDGANWTSTTYAYPGAVGQLDDIVWTGTQYAGSSSQGIYTSPEGVSYSRLSNYNLQPEGLACAANYLAALAWSGSEYVVDTSVDGSTWGRVPASCPFQTLKGFYRFGSLWLAVEVLDYNPNGDTSRIYTSSDLRTWTERLKVNRTITDVAWSGSTYVAVTSENAAYWSTTGSQWTAASLPDGATSAVAWAGTRWIAAGVHTFSSSDGSTWSRVGGDPASLAVRDLAWNGHVLVGVGQSGTVFTATP